MTGHKQQIPARLGQCKLHIVSNLHLLAGVCDPFPASYRICVASRPRSVFMLGAPLGANETSPIYGKPQQLSKVLLVQIQDSEISETLSGPYLQRLRFSACQDFQHRGYVIKWSSRDSTATAFGRNGLLRVLTYDNIYYHNGMSTFPRNSDWESPSLKVWQKLAGTPYIPRTNFEELSFDIPLRPRVGLPAWRRVGRRFVGCARRRAARCRRRTCRRQRPVDV